MRQGKFGEPPSAVQFAEQFGLAIDNPHFSPFVQDFYRLPQIIGTNLCCTFSSQAS
jgi:hypothetical protein